MKVISFARRLLRRPCCRTAYVSLDRNQESLIAIVLESISKFAYSYIHSSSLHRRAYLAFIVAIYIRVTIFNFWPLWL
jgi:hypothetical protein